MDLYTVKIGDGAIAVDDMILVKDYPATAGSKILEGFTPLFSAEAVTRLEKAGFALCGKTPVGEFGLTLFSSGAARAVKEGAEAALSVEVNGSGARGAAREGVLFLKPTYGTVSRYGVISTAASGETVSVSASSAQKLAEVLGVISGHDEKDGTSLPEERYSYLATGSLAGKRIALVKELLALCDDKTRERVLAFAEECKKAGAVVDEIETDLFSKAGAAWQILSAAETCNNLSRYDGVKYGCRAEGYKNIDQLYTASRTEGFTFLTKAVILYGSDVLTKGRYELCYDKALRVKRVLSEEMKALFSRFDAVLKPPMSSFDLVEKEGKEALLQLSDEAPFTAMESLLGLPSAVCAGVSLAADHFGENTLLSLAALGERMGK